MRSRVATSAEVLSPMCVRSGGRERCERQSLQQRCVRESPVRRPDARAQRTRHMQEEGANRARDEAREIERQAQAGETTIGEMSAFCMERECERAQTPALTRRQAREMRGEDE